MVNRFLQLLENKLSLSTKIQVKQSPAKIATLIMHLKKILWKIENFGTQANLVEVTITFKEPTVGDAWLLKRAKIYFTGIEMFEAIECVKYKIENIINIHAIEIPLGKPINL